MSVLKVGIWVIFHIFCVFGILFIYSLLNSQIRPLADILHYKYMHLIFNLRKI